MSVIVERIRDLFLGPGDPDRREEDELAWDAADEIARLTEENKRLREDLDRVTSGTWSKELARLSSVNARLTAKDKRLRAVVDAARDVDDSGYPGDHAARVRLSEAIRDLDGELDRTDKVEPLVKLCPTCKGEAALEQYNCPTCHGRR